MALSLASWTSPEGTVWFAGIFRDLTERFRADQAVRNTQALYHSLVENIPLNVLRKDLEGRITFCNSLFCENAGVTQEDLLGKTDFDLYPKILANKYRRDDLKVISGGETMEKIEGHRTADGRKIYVEVFKTPVRDASGEIVGVQIIFLGCDRPAGGRRGVETGQGGS